MCRGQGVAKVPAEFNTIKQEASFEKYHEAASRVHQGAKGSNQRKKKLRNLNLQLGLCNCKCEEEEMGG